MTIRPKTALPLSAVAAVILALSGCHAGTAASGSSGVNQPQSPAASSTDQATTAAGSGAAPAATGGNKHACSVVTEQEASTALGGPDLGPGQETPTSPAGVGDCVYGGVTGAGVRVFVDTSGVGKAVYESDRSSYPSSQVTDVPGVGDGAFEITTSASQVTVSLYKGETYVSITLDTGATTAPLKDKVVALATNAAGRV
jgi:hypothetical protein